MLHWLIIFSELSEPSNLLLFQEANKPPDSWFELKVNTHVYVTGLPEDVTVEEVSGCNSLILSFLLVVGILVKHLIPWYLLQVVEVFSKCGIIKEVGSFICMPKFYGHYRTKNNLSFRINSCDTNHRCWTEFQVENWFWKSYKPEDNQIWLNCNIYRPGNWYWIV